jgi:hypothetical protein
MTKPQVFSSEHTHTRPQPLTILLSNVTSFARIFAQPIAILPEATQRYYPGVSLPLPLIFFRFSPEEICPSRSTSIISNNRYF